MVDFGKETVDLEDEDTVDRIIQCSQAAAPFFSVRYDLTLPYTTPVLILSDESRYFHNT